MTKPGALYIHFPFCVSVCPYCDFVVYAGKDTRGPANRIDALVDAQEIEIGLRTVPGSNLGSVYFGGGTPSLMTPAQIERLLAAAERAFTLLPDAEITIEANPGGGERGDLTGFRAAGGNRISIGAQSLDLAEL
jgi:oxygen-independent coproporphyrinogen-3 oxidase